MKIAIAHEHPPTRQVLSRALSVRLRAEVTDFSCVEDVLASKLDYDIFVVYNNFGHKLSGVQGVKEIRKRVPRAFIIGVSGTPNYDRKFLPAGADKFILRSGNEIQELVGMIQHQLAT
jgi:DNA-binding NarL/FixJ family response regulator